jgi:hypothetical protein
MARYIARFMKDVLGENGHQTEICQRSLEIEASNKTGAVDVAKVKFCKAESVKDWSLHADRIQVTDAEFSSEYPISDCERSMHVLFDKQDNGSGLFHLGDDRENIYDDHGHQTLAGFIDEDKPRATDHDARQSTRFALTYAMQIRHCG